MSLRLFVLFALYAFFSFSEVALAQNTLIASEDFEGISYITTINDTGLASNTGSNKWIINNQYNGGAIYPNTISQDSTFGGLITFPNGNYLHIHDSVASVNNSIANTNYDPQSISDRFAVIDEFCTLGYNGVTVAYYYLCMGNATNAYGQVYYSINNGTWTAFSGATYTNTYKWKYTALIDPVFDNQSSVRIGFRWANNSTNSAPSASFAIDDIRIVGNFDVGFVGITIDTLQMVPVCQNFNFLANFNLTNTLCGAGFYEAELSNASGNFNNPTSLGTYQLSNQTAFQSLFLNIPANTSPGSCYKIRIARIDVTPNVLSNESDCFTILNCPNTINTLQPTMLSNPNDTICVGSVIDVTFFSTGIFTNNTYTVLLSDSLGNFSSSSNILGNLQSSLTFDPALGSLPGAIPGVLNSFTQPIPEGCNYYLKIISSDTLVLINVYGPFCVKHCDIQTNIFPNIQACINSINGFDTLINININQFDTTTIYASNNLFQLQLLNSMTFNVVNTGGFGSIAASSDTTMPISIPNLGGLAALGLQPGIYYARIVANNSSSMWNNLGTLIRVIIGAPQDIPLSVNAYNPTNFNGYLNVGDSTICLGQAIYFTVFPNYNSQSIYTWSLNTESNWSTDPSTGVLFNQVGNFYMSIIETNYGCVGLGSDTTVVHVLGVPSSTISGPSQVIMNDTVNYSTIFGAFNTYDWNCNNAIIVSNSNNNFEILFPSVGAYQVSCTSTNICSTSTATKNINVFSNVGLAQNNHSSKVTLLNNISDGNFIILLSDNLATPYQVNVMQTNGAEINATKEIIENIKQYELNLSYLPVGIYFLRISSISSNQFFKIVKI